MDMLFKFYRKIYRISKKYFILSMLEILIKILIPLIIIVFPKLIIEMVMKKSSYIVYITLVLVIGKYILITVDKELKLIGELLGEEINYRFELELLEKIINLDYEYLEKPDILNMKEKALEGFTENESSNLAVYNENLIELIASVVSLIGVIYIVFKIDVYFLIILLIVVVLNFFIEKLIADFELKNWKKWIPINRRFRMVYNLMYDFRNGPDIRIYNSEKFFIDKVISTNEKMYEVMANEAIIVSKYGILTNLLEGLKIFFINFIAVISLLENKITIPDFTAYLLAINLFLNGIKKITNSVVNIGKNSGYIKEYFKFLNLKNRVSGVLEPKNREYTLEFKNVYFKYPGSEKEVLKNISFTIKNGEKISIVGHNGAGKSTVIKLILGLYKPDKGEILLNGVNIEKYNKEKYLKCFATIFQDFNLFPLSVGENICCKERYSLEEIEKLLKSVDIYKKIISLENGVDTVPIKNYEEDSTDFSLGQKQKIALARAIYKNSDILILDEPTSSMDIKTEIELYKNFKNLTNGKIAIYISHRVVSSKFCDKIFVFENGEIVEMGNHIELMKKKGIYNKMYRLQKNKLKI